MPDQRDIHAGIAASDRQKGREDNQMIDLAGQPRPTAPEEPTNA